MPKLSDDDYIVIFQIAKLSSFEKVNKGIAICFIHEYFFSTFATAHNMTPGIRKLYS